MAYQKKTESIKTIKEESEIQKELAEKDKEVKDLKEQMALLQSQISLLLQNQSVNKQVAQDDYEEVEVGCRMFMDTPLTAQNGNKTITIDGNGTRFVSVEDMRIYLKDSNRINQKLFEEDVLYFVNEKDYQRFKIRKTVNLSEENILRILNMSDVNDTIREVATITNNKVNFTLVHCFQYQVVRLIMEKRDLSGWTYDNRTALERYLGQKFDDLARSVDAYNIIVKHKVQ